MTQELRETYSGEYRLTSLWSDRRRILDDPAIALQPGRGLVNTPVRFAMALSVVPLLLASWVMAQLAGLLAPDLPAPPRSAAAEFSHVLHERLPGLDPDALRALSGEFKTLPEEIRALRSDGRIALDRVSESTDGAANAAARAWLAEVDRASMQDGQRRILVARMAQETLVKAKIADLGAAFQESMLQGGAIADAMFALSFLISARVFRRMVRRDPRFVHAAYADRFYLYYVTSRLFWWIVPMVLLFGTVSYAHAAGLPELMVRANTAQMLLGLASTLHLLLCSGSMARTLAGGDTDRRGVASLAWRSLVSIVLSWLLMMLFVFAASISLLIGYTVWLSR